MASFVLRRILRRPSQIFVPRYFSSAISKISSSQSSITKNYYYYHSNGVSIRFASSNAVQEKEVLISDKNLLSVLDAEISCAEETHTEGKEVIMPKDFPFEIIDTPGDQAIVIKREYGGESVQAAIYLNDDEQIDNEEDENEVENEGEGDKDSLQPSLAMVVTVNKGSASKLENGSRSQLEFCCNLNSDELEIETVALKKTGESDNEGAYAGPEFLDLDESLRKAFQRYLSARGIKASLFSSLYDYLVKKDDREYVHWLKNIKEFVGK